MGSDGSTDIEDSRVSEMVQPAGGRVPQLSLSRPPAPLSEAEMVARAKITEAIANSKEAIDLM
jgi:hypothetical protein